MKLNSFLIGIFLLLVAIILPLALYLQMPKIMAYTFLSGKFDSARVGLLANFIEDHYLEEVPVSDLMHQALKGMVSHLDPWSVYISEQERVDYDRLASGELIGIGIEFGFRQESMQVLQVFEGGPAYQAGLKPQDRFVAIDGINVEKVTDSQRIVSLVTGLRGTKVNLKMYRPEQADVLEFVVPRDVVEIPALRSELLDNNILHLHLFRFQGGSDVQIDSELKKYPQLEGLILDLRGNAGGLLSMSVAVASLFLPKGTVVVNEDYRDRQDVVHEVKDAGPWQQLPVALLVDRSTASASEVLAGCFQDHKRALVWGERTYGKGLVQELVSLENGKSLLKLTVARYLTPLGRDVNKSEDNPGGLEPDYIVDSANKTPNVFYLEALKNHWQTLEIPMNFDDFIDQHPPGRVELDAVDLALDQAFAFLCQPQGDQKK